MDARTKAGFWLSYLSWVPMIAWQSSPEWAPKLIGEPRYKAIAAAPGVDVINWVWFVGGFAAGLYLVFSLDAVSFFRRLRRKSGGRGEGRGD